MAEVYLKGKIDRSNEKRYDFCKLQSKNEYHIFFLSVSSVTHELSGEQSKSSNALTGSVPSVQVSLIPNIVTERLPGLDRKSKRGVKKGEIKWDRRLFCSVLSICRRFPAYLAAV